jgi:cytochrome c-type biogenesis protein CcmH/NrfF
LRSHIEEKVELSWTNRQIDQWLVANYGEQVLGRPRGMVSWIVPIGAVTIGLVALGSVLIRRKQLPVSAPGAQITQEDRDRVTADLGRYTRDTTE